MCDCFHLAFPNWHSPGTGAGRRLRGPERDGEDDSTCEEASEFLEGERPRPQGSSPVEEFPAEKQGEEELYDPLHKSGSGRKGKRVGFGSLFEKRSSAKMIQTEEIQNGESGLIVKTAKEACAEGLVVSGGGKEGIFIKEVKPESPASKNLSVKEGDQILSATVYFDDVSYEDALQILQHAQPYKMEFCLKRKAPETSTLDNAGATQPEGEESSSPEVRGRVKTKRTQEARISWPKFPSFSKGHKSHFKRSHSTSEAEDQRKLEMSPTTSDTESPLKSPLKSPDGKEKKKKHRIKLKMKMKGLRSKSVEQPEGNNGEPTSVNLEGAEIQQAQDTSDAQSPEELGTAPGEMSQVYVVEEPENKESTKIRSEYTFPSLQGSETQHKVELICVDKTLKTTDISVLLAEASPKAKSTPEGKKKKKKERSELKVNIQGKEKVSPSIISHTEVQGRQLDIDVNTQIIDKESLEKTLGPGDMDMSMPKVDVSLDMSDIGLLRKSPRIGSEKQWKDRTILIPESESYGIRTRGPLADMATSKTQFDPTPNGFQFTTSDTVGVSGTLKAESDLLSSITDTKKPIIPTAVISQPKAIALEIKTSGKSTDGIVAPSVDFKVTQLETKASTLPTETNIDDILAELGTTAEPKFKLPKVDLSGFVPQEPIKMTEVEHIKAQLPKREDLQIPGMEDTASTGKLQTPGIKLPKIEKMGDAQLDAEIQAQSTEVEFNIEDVKAAVSKLPAYKLPKGDISCIHGHRDITMTDVNAEKFKVKAKVSPAKISDVKADFGIILPEVTMKKLPVLGNKDQHTSTRIKLPKIELPRLDDQEPITVTQMDYSKPKLEEQKNDEVQKTDDGTTGGLGIRFKLPNREDLEIPGMEAIEKTHLQMSKIKVVQDTEIQEVPSVQIIAPSVDMDMKGNRLTLEGKIETSPTSPKGHDKKSKKSKMSMPGFGITKPDMRFPDIGIELPKKKTSPQKKLVEVKASGIEMKVPQDKEKEVTLPSGEINLKMPQMETDISVSQPKIDIEGPDGDIKGLSFKGDTDTSKLKKQFKLPKIGGKFSKGSADITADIKIPELDISEAKIDIEKGISDVDIEAPSTGKAKGKIKMPDVSLPKVKLPKVELKPKPVEIDLPKPEITTAVPELGMKYTDVAVQGKVNIPEVEAEDIQSVEIKTSPTKFKLPSMKFPKFGVTAPKVAVEATGVDADIKVPEVNTDGTTLEVKLPEPELSISGEIPSVDIKAPSVDIEAPSVEEDKKTKGAAIEGKGSKFKLPKFGISLPKVKGPEFDISVSRPDVDVSLPEGKAHTPEIEFKVPSVEAEVAMPEVEVKELKKPKMSVEGKVDVPEVDSKGLDIKIKKPSFSFPKFGFSKAEAKAPGVDVSLPKVDVSIQEGSEEVKAPEVDTKALEGEVELKDANIDGSPMKFKLPSMKFPKFGVTAPKGSKDLPDVDAELKVSGETPSVDIKGPSVDIERPLVDADIKTTGVDLEGQGSKFKMPKFGISLPKVKGPEVDLSVSKPEIYISLPEGKVEVKSPEVEGVSVEGKVEVPEVESKGLDIKMKKPSFSFPKFGFSKAEDKAPEVDVSLPKVDISIPEGSVEVKAAVADISLLQGKVEVQTPDVKVEGVSVDGKVDVPEVDSKGLDIKMKKPSFSFPKFGFSKPDVKAPEVDVSLPKVDVSIPEGSVKVKLPEVDIKAPECEAELTDANTGGSPMKFKLPTIKFPKFGVTVPKGSIDLSDVDADIKGPEVSVPDAELTLSGIVPPVDIKGPSVDIEGASVDVDMKTTGVELEGQGSKFKLPKLGVSLPKVKGPEVDLSVSKPEIDISLLEGKVELKPPEIEGVSVEGKVDVPEVESKGLDIKMKKSSFSFPKFGFSKAEVKAPEVDVSLPKVDISIPERSVEVKAPEIDASLPQGKVDVQTADVKVEGVSVEGKVIVPEVDTKGLDIKMKKPSFSFPKFGFSKPDVKASEVDVSLPKVDVSIPEGSVKVPEVDFKAPEGEVELTDTNIGGSPMKFKLPSMKFPKFGVTAPKGSIDLPGVDADIKGPQVSLPEAELKVSGEATSVDIKGPSVDIEGPSVDLHMKTAGVELDGQGSTFKLPKFGVSLPKVKGPEVDLSVSKPEVDISLPEGKVEVKPPAIEAVSVEGKVDIPEVESKGLDIKMKKPSFSFPKFGFSKAEVKAPEVDVSLPKVDISIPEGSVEVKAPEIDASLPQGKVDVQVADVKVEGVSVEGKVDVPEVDTKGLDIKMKKPSFSFPKFGFSKPDAKATDVDVSLPKVDVSIPEGSVKVPEVDFKAPEGAVELTDTNIDGTPMKFKLPSMKFPKFGVTAPQGSIDLPGVDANIKGPQVSLPEAELKVSGEEPSVDIKGPSVDIEGPSVDLDMKTAGVELDGQGGKFKLPKFGVSLPKVKSPEVDLSVSKTEVDISLPEGKVEVKPPAVEGVSVEAKVDIPEVESKGLDIKMKKPSFSFPKFGFSKAEVKAPEVDVSLPKVDVSIPKGSVEVKAPEIDISLPQGKVDVQTPDVKVEGVSVEGKVDIPEVESKGLDIKMKKPSFSFPKFGFSKAEVKVPDVDVSLPKVDVSIPEGSMEVKAPEIDISLLQGKVDVQTPDVKVEGVSVEGKVVVPEVDTKGLDIKIKKPSFSFPKFGFSKPDVKAPEVDVSLPKVDVSIPEGSVKGKVPEVDIKALEGEVELTDANIDGSPMKFKLPSIKFPKFGVTAPKGSIDLPEVDADIKGPEVSLPDSELKVSGEAPSVDIKGPSVDIEGPSIDVDMKTAGVELEGQGSKFKLPKFGVSLPKVKGPEVDLSVSKPEVDISLPEEKVEVKPPEVEGVSVEGKADIPEVESKGVDIKMKKPSFSFPKFGFSKSEVKAPEVDVSLPKVDVSIPKGSVEVKAPEIDISLPQGKVDVQTPDVKVEGVSVEGKVDIPEVESKGLDTKIKKPSFSFPKFGFSKAEVKAPEVDVSLPKADVSILEGSVEANAPDIDASLPQGKVEVKKPVVKVESLSVEGKANVPDVDSKGLDMKMKKPSFSFPKFGFSKAEVKAPEVDVSLPKVDVSIPEGSVEVKAPEVDIKAPEGEVELTDAFGSPTKFKLPTMKFPKFGVAVPKVTVETPVSLPDAKLKVSGEAPSIDIQGPSVDVGISLPKVKGPEVEMSISKPEVDVSLPEGKVVIQPADVKAKVPSIEAEVGIAKVDGAKIDVKEVKPRISFPKFGFSKPEVKASEIDVSLSKVDVSLHEASFKVKGPEMDVKAPETESKDAVVVEGSPSKFKLPSFKLPKFGVAAPKASDIKAEITVPEVDSADLNTVSNINVELPRIPDVEPEVDVQAPAIEGTVSIPEAEIPKQAEDTKGIGSPSKFKLPAFMMPKFGISKTKPEDVDVEIASDVKTPQITLEVEHKEDTQGPEKSPKFTLPSIGEVLRGFDIEFNVPTLEEGEATKEETAPEKQELEVEAPAEAVSLHQEAEVPEKSKFKFRFPKLGFSLSSEDSDKVESTAVKVESTAVIVEESEKPIEPQDKQKLEDDTEEQKAKTERGGWFKFPMFSSPTKTAKVSEKEISKPDEELEKSPASENMEDDVSLTFSVRSSDAFADISSAVTTEQVGPSSILTTEQVSPSMVLTPEQVDPSFASPTKVTVKYAEPTTPGGVGGIQGDIIMSTARTELISMEPHLPEKVNIPFSSEMSSSSLDTLGGKPGKIHVITSNVQATPATQQATVFTNFEAHGVRTVPLQQVTLKTASAPWSVEQTSRTQSGQRTFVEKHVVKEMSGEDMETVVITPTTRVFEADSDATASSIQQLRDTMHSEKMRFFEGREMVMEKVVVSTETHVRHVDSSAEETEGE